MQTQQPTTDDAPQKVVNLADWCRKKALAKLPTPPLDTWPPSESAVPDDWVAREIRICFEHPEILTPWETHFLRSIRRLRRLSAAQVVCLRGICDKVCIEFPLVP